MVENKIPDNSRAIGAAAALGDLSENSEWESAMEEQRNLTTRATTMDQELRKARLIEDQELPEGKVAPGDGVGETGLPLLPQARWRIATPVRRVVNHRRIGRMVGGLFA